MDAVQTMGPQDIVKLRDDLANMGLAGQSHTPQPIDR